jgi:hypothetical protein
MRERGDTGERNRERGEMGESGKDRGERWEREVKRERSE